MSFGLLRLCFHERSASSPGHLLLRQVGYRRFSLLARHDVSYPLISASQGSGLALDCHHRRVHYRGEASSCAFTFRLSRFYLVGV